jgi:hypothetical protein
MAQLSYRRHRFDHPERDLAVPACEPDFGLLPFKFQHPPPYRLVRNVQPTLGQEILKVPVTQREA